MATVTNSVVALRVASDELIPEQITRALGHEPSESWSKGHTFVTSNGCTVVRKTGMWVLSATDSPNADIEAQVGEILGQVTADLSVWVKLCKGHDIYLTVGYFMGSTNDGFSLDAQVIRSLSERGISISFDMYAPIAEEITQPDA